MCGICGVFNYASGNAVDERMLRSMNGTMTHRGPDDEGTALREGVGLAMRRLSIIDVAGGHQPISNEDETVVVVMNGEIYNYRELRTSLMARGHTFRTRSDTETIVHLYEEYGADCVSHLDGMFAFALYDSRPERGPKLLIARDRVGKKPLYYCDSGGALVFGSELKPLLVHPGVSRELDAEAVDHFLSLRMVPAPLSIFRSVRKLPAGSILECTSRGVTLRRYWSYAPKLLDAPAVHGRDAVADVRQLLFRAVEKRLVSEVPLGAFLSGGLDSSTVVAIMSRLQSEPVKTFAIGFSGSEMHNELPYARAVAKHCRTSHHEYLLEPDVVELIEELVHYADEPFAIPSAIPTLLLARAARRDVTVVLTGDGGDEVFYGYETYLYEQWAASYRLLPRAIDPVLRGVFGLLPGRVDSRFGRMRSRFERFTRAVRSDTATRRLSWGSAFTDDEKGTLYALGFRRADERHSTAEFLARLIPDADLHPSVEQNLLDVEVWLADEMLAKVDRMTMAASVEARCPLLDRDLIEYVAALPMRVKLPGWRMRDLKHVLRDAVRDLLPREVLDRAKQGFNPPLDVWLRGEARSYAHSMLSRERVEQRGVFNPEAVERLLEAHDRGSLNAGNRIYTLLVFEAWATKMLGT